MLSSQQVEQGWRPPEQQDGDSILEKYGVMKLLQVYLLGQREGIQRRKRRYLWGDIRMFEAI